MAFARRYHSLAAPLATIEFNEDEGFGSWTIEPNVHATIDPQVYRFITEMQIGIHISLMRDIMSAAFAPDQIILTYSETDDFGLPVDLIGCRDASRVSSIELFFDQPGWIKPHASETRRLIQ